MIRPVHQEDVPSVTAIYNHYVNHTTYTFDEKPLTENEIAHKIKSFTIDYPWLVYEKDNDILGFTFACSWKSKSTYRHTVESTIYLKPNFIGRGIGKKLYSALLFKLKEMGIYVVLAGIALPNDISVSFHEKFGFEKVAQLKDVGYKFNQ